MNVVTKFIHRKVTAFLFYIIGMGKKIDDYNVNNLLRKLKIFLIIKFIFTFLHFFLILHNKLMNEFRQIIHLKFYQIYSFYSIHYYHMLDVTKYIQNCL